MADPNSLQADISGVNPVSGAPEPWRRAYSRYNRNIGDVVNDPGRGPWQSNHNGVVYQGHFDAYEQIVPINEQIAWRHKFSNGKTYDHGDVMIALGEFLVKQGFLS